jgi:conjugative transfer signal peptidase TraF
MNGQLGTLITMAAAATMLATTIGQKPAPWLVWNASASVPIGLYKVTPATHLTITDLVVALPPATLAPMLADEGYLPRGVPLIKRVLALPGQTVCRTGVFVTVDRILMGSAREKDRNGHPLPSWQGCRVVVTNHVFLMNWDEPDSLNGRYFGTLPLESVVGRAEPLWTRDDE